MFEGIMQPMHLVVILIIALLFFGPSKLADLGKGLGEGIRGFKDALKDPAPAKQSSPDNGQTSTQLHDGGAAPPPASDRQ
jgi:sec-independent protein translocase protein TatA